MKEIPMALSYVREKLGCAVDCLDVENQGIKTRLFNAFMAFHTLRPNYFIEIEQQKFRDLVNELTEVESKGDEGDLQATINTMTNEKAEALAQRIRELYDYLVLLTKR
jgi:DNA-binding transcriptional regulator GbsR (MarR family)